MPVDEPVKPDHGLAAGPLPSRPRRRARRWALGCGGTVLLLALLWVGRAALLTAVAQFLSVGQPPVRADAIFIFGGDAELRPFATAALYHRGYAPRVLVPAMEVGQLASLGVTPSQTEVFLRILRLRGVPDSAIAVVALPGRGTASTRDDALALRRWATAHHLHHVLAVTSFWHTRRARSTLRRELAGSGLRVTLYGARAGTFREDNWWRSETGMLVCFEEYVKLLRDLLGAGDG